MQILLVCLKSQRQSCSLLGWGFPTSIIATRQSPTDTSTGQASLDSKSPHRQVILDCITLTVNTTHHKFCLYDFCFATVNFSACFRNASPPCFMCHCHSGVFVVNWERAPTSSSCLTRPLLITLIDCPWKLGIYRKVYNFRLCWTLLNHAVILRGVSVFS